MTLHSDEYEKHPAGDSTTEGAYLFLRCVAPRSGNETRDGITTTHQHHDGDCAGHHPSKVARYWREKMFDG